MRSPEEFAAEIGAAIKPCPCFGEEKAIALIRARDAEVREAGVRAGIAASAKCLEEGAAICDAAAKSWGDDASFGARDRCTDKASVLREAVDDVRALDAAAIVKEAPRG